ncbi:MAG: histone deacetylase, partial [Luteibaculum sp.]
MLKIAWHPCYAHPLPEGHRFPMEKYTLLPQQLLYEGTIDEVNLFVPNPMLEETILWTHCAEYWQKLKALNLNKQEIRRTGFPLSEALVNREITIMDGSAQAANFALEYGVAMNVAGGTHHAYSNCGEGFCLLNDQAIAANYLLKTGRAKRIFIVDLDVHQGNGTAEIFSENPNVFTFSMHGKNNFPLRKEKSDLDIGLEDGIDDKNYLQILSEHLPRQIDLFEPDFMFYQCGVDVLETDKLGRLGLSIAGCKSRDRMVLELAKKNEIPVVCSMGGGYSEEIRY